MSYSAGTIPASYFVNVIPGVIPAGATGITMSELMLSTSWRIPTGSVYSFPSALAVSNFFGPTSTEAIEAGVYFNGYNGCTQLPSNLLMAQYPIANVGAWLRSGPVSGLTLTQLQAISGVLTITIDGTPHTSSSISLSAATSFTNAAELINNGLGLTGPTQAAITGSMGATFTGNSSGTTTLTTTSVTGLISVGDGVTGSGVPGGTFIVSQSGGTAGGAGTYITNNATTLSSIACIGLSIVLDVSAVASGTIQIGAEVVGTSVLNGTYVTAFQSGSGGTGTYITTRQQTVAIASESMTVVMPVVTYDTQSGSFLIISSTTGASSTIGFGSGTIAAQLNLTQATGAINSQGAVAAVPATFMTAITAMTTNWASFQTLFDPDAGSGNTQKQLFAAWTNAQNNRYAYLVPDTDITPTESTQATTSLGYILGLSNSSGTCPLYVPGAGYHLGAFVGGFIASVNFDATNGRATLAYKSQSGLVPDVTSEQVLANLQANNYNCYVAVATAGGSWEYAFPGSITGPYKWLDSYINQIWLNNQCQIALMNLLTTLGSVPYDPVGYGQIRSTLAGGASDPVVLPPASPVAAALNNGIIDTSVPLSATQVLAVNALAGMAIDQVLFKQGWYLIIQPATAAIRAARTSPTVILLYCDGGSVQQIDLSSLLVQ